MNLKIKNNIFKIATVAVAAVAVFSSCLKDDSDLEFGRIKKSKGAGVLNFELSGSTSTPKTYGPGSTQGNTPGNKKKFRTEPEQPRSSRGQQAGTTQLTTPFASAEREKKLNPKDPVLVLVFKSSGEYVSTVKPTKREGVANAHMYNFVVEYAGTYDFLFVANANAALRKTLMGEGALGSLRGKTKADIGKALVNQLPGENNQAGTTEDSYFVMTSFRKDIEIKKDAEKNLDKIHLVRLSARIDVKSKIENFRINKIVVKNRYKESQLHRFNDLSMNQYDGQALKFDQKTYTTSEGLVSDRFSDCTGTIYCYENVASDANNMELELHATYQGQNLKNPYKITLKNRKIERNKLYSIVLTPKGSGNLVQDPESGIDFDIIENEWNDEEVLVGNDFIDKDLVPDSFLVKDLSSDKVKVSPNTSNVQKIEVTRAAANSFVLEVKSKTIQSEIKILTAGNVEATDDHVKVEYLSDKSKENIDGTRTDVYKISLKENEEETEKKYCVTISNPLKSAAIHFFDLIHARKYNLPAKEKNPLNAFAEYNLKQDATGFVDTHAYDHANVGYFSQDDLKSKFVGKILDIDGKKYRLPDNQELGLVTCWTSGYIDYHNSYNDVSETIKVKGETVSGVKSYFRGGGQINGNYVSYALRFKGGNPANRYTTAYRYEWKGSYKRDMEIKSIYLGGYGQDYTMDTIAKEDYWNPSKSKDAKNIVTRIFPGSGYKTGSIHRGGYTTFYWSATKSNDNYWHSYYHENHYSYTTTRDASYHLPIRLMQVDDQGVATW